MRGVLLIGRWVWLSVVVLMGAACGGGGLSDEEVQQRIDEAVSEAALTTTSTVLTTTTTIPPTTTTEPAPVLSGAESVWCAEALKETPITGFSPTPRPTPNLDVVLQVAESLGHVSGFYLDGREFLAEWESAAGSDFDAQYVEVCKVAFELRP